MKMLTQLENDIFDLKITLDEHLGKQFLIQIATGLIGVKTFSKLEKINTYTTHFKLEFKETSLTITTHDIVSIDFDNELSRNNTKSIHLELKNNQYISFEYEI